jgi:hypothetical protein
MLLRARPLIGAAVGLLLGFAEGIVSLKLALSNPLLHPTDPSNQAFVGTELRYLVLHPLIGLICGYLVGMGYGAHKR